MGRKLNPSNMREFVRSPGIDTRYWIKLAHVDNVVVDPEEGVFADVTLQPESQTVTAFVGSPYAGDGFGFYAPIQVDDLVLVAIPDGETDAGSWVISRAWNSADKPLAESMGETRTPESGAPGQYEAGELVALRNKRDTNLKLVTSGTGKVTVQAEGSGEIKILSGTGMINMQGATQPFVRGDTYADKLSAHLDQIDTLNAGLSAAFAAINTWCVAVQPIADPTIAVTPTLTLAMSTTWPAIVTTYTAAAAAFRAARAQYLSTRIKGE